MLQELEGLRKFECVNDESQMGWIKIELEFMVNGIITHTHGNHVKMLVQSTYFVTMLLLCECHEKYSHKCLHDNHYIL